MRKNNKPIRFEIIFRHIHLVSTSYKYSGFDSEKIFRYIHCRKIWHQLFCFYNPKLKHPIVTAPSFLFNAIENEGIAKSLFMLNNSYRHAFIICKLIYFCVTKEELYRPAKWVGIEGINSIEFDRNAVILRPVLNRPVSAIEYSS